MRVILIILMSTLLSGCLYPNEQMSENEATNDEQLNRVQAAVDEFQEMNNGILPIETRDQQTPVFIKYPINFKPLQNDGVMGEIPSNSYEEGGPYSYVIIDVEENPTVKVADTRVTQRLRRVNYEINLYRNKNDYAPFKDEIGQGIFSIDQDKLNLNDGYTVQSPYSSQELDLILGATGDALVDFRPEVYQLMEEEGIESYDGDLRFLLAEHYPIVPAYSPAMYLEDGEIILEQTE